MKSLLTLHSKVEMYVDWRIFRCAAPRMSRCSRQNPHFLFWTPLGSVLELDAGLCGLSLVFQGHGGIVPRSGHGAFFLASLLTVILW
jgi:hypothetical protein